MRRGLLNKYLDFVLMLKIVPTLALNNYAYVHYAVGALYGMCLLNKYIYIYIYWRDPFNSVYHHV